MGFGSTLRKLNNIEEFNVVEESMEIIRRESALLIWMLQQQLLEGIDGKGEPKTLIRTKKGKPLISPEYSENTIREKSSMSGNAAITDRITHYMSGSFFEEMMVVTEGKSFGIISNVEYFNDIIAHSGSGLNIMELTEENQKLFYNDVLIPELKIRFDARFQM